MEGVPSTTEVASASSPYLMVDPSRLALAVLSALMFPASYRFAVWVFGYSPTGHAELAERLASRIAHDVGITSPGSVLVLGLILVVAPFVAYGGLAIACSLWMLLTRVTAGKSGLLLNPYFGRRTRIEWRALGKCGARAPDGGLYANAVALQVLGANGGPGEIVLLTKTPAERDSLLQSLSCWRAATSHQ